MQLNIMEGRGKGDLDYVKTQFKKIEENIRQRILERGEDESAGNPMEVINFTHLSGRCGDRVIGVNVSQLANVSDGF